MLVNNSLQFTLLHFYKMEMHAFQGKTVSQVIQNKTKNNNKQYETTLFENVLSNSKEGEEFFALLKSEGR